LFLAAIWASLNFGGTEHLGDSAMHQYILNQIRVPKTITAILAGCTLALSGLILQIIFRNPLAGPYVLGVSSGASLTVAIGLLASPYLHIATHLFSGKLFIVACAVSGSLAATFLILMIARKVISNVILLLIGLMIAQICGALQMSLEYFADPYNLKAFVIWGMGSLSGTTRSDLQVYLPLTIVFVSLLFFQLKPLSALLYGQHYAESLGFDFRKKRLVLILISSLMTGLTTAFCGPIAFAGIAIPIVSRMLFTTANQWVHFFS
jgi:iron complex transport system permease protein